jgi:hypothetical protein
MIGGRIGPGWVGRRGRYRSWRCSLLLVGGRRPRGLRLGPWRQGYCWAGDFAGAGPA